MNSIKTYGFLFFIIFSFNLNGQENFKNEGERIKYANNLFEEQKFIEAETHMSNFLSNKKTSSYYLCIKYNMDKLGCKFFD